MRTIQVTGKGQLRVKPDQTRITLSLEGLYPEYGEALRRSAEDTERIKDLLTEQVEFDSDNARLGKVLYALAKCPLQPEFRLSYTVKDPEAAKNQLLGKAVADARAKAQVLTQAAGVTLKDIQSIDYSWDRIDFEIQPMNRMLMAKECADEAAGFDINIDPDDIDVSDTVTVLSHAVSLYEAILLNESLKTIMAAMVTLPNVSRVELEEDYQYTDPSTKTYRYKADYNITYMEGAI